MASGGVGIEAIEAVYRARYRSFLRVALAITGDRASAEETVQEAFAHAIRGRFGFRGEATLDTWLWSILLNEARTGVRRGRDHLSLDEWQEPATNGHHRDAWADLRAAVAALPERQRTVVFLRHYADLGYEEIGEILQIERGTVAATLNAAHRTLRRHVTEVQR